MFGFRPHSRVYHGKVTQLLIFTATRASSFIKAFNFVDISLHFHSVSLMLVWASKIQTICLEHLESAPVLLLLISVVAAMDTSTAIHFMIPLGSKVLNTETSECFLRTHIKSPS
jgi:uncharacterized membrane protein